MEESVTFNPILILIGISWPVVSVSASISKVGWSRPWAWGRVSMWGSWMCVESGVTLLEMRIIGAYYGALWRRGQRFLWANSQHFNFLFFSCRFIFKGKCAIISDFNFQRSASSSSRAGAGTISSSVRWRLENEATYPSPRQTCELCLTFHIWYSYWEAADATASLGFDLDQVSK